MIKDLPEIGGRRLEVTIMEFERSCLLAIRELLEENVDKTRLIAILSNAVRLSRECADVDLSIGRPSLSEEKRERAVKQLVIAVNEYRRKEIGGLSRSYNIPMRMGSRDEIISAALAVALAYDEPKPCPPQVSTGWPVQP